MITTSEALQMVSTILAAGRRNDDAAIDAIPDGDVALALYVLESAQTVARQDDQAHVEAIHEGMPLTAEDSERHIAAIRAVDELSGPIATLRSELRARR
mgnify:CR=1 FL=1